MYHVTQMDDILNLLLKDSRQCYTFIKWIKCGCGYKRNKASIALSLLGRLGPLHAQDQVVVSEAVESGDGLGCVLLPVVVHEGEALAGRE